MSRQVIDDVADAFPTTFIARVGLRKSVHTGSPVLAMLRKAELRFCSIPSTQPRQQGLLFGNPLRKVG